MRRRRKSYGHLGFFHFKKKGPKIGMHTAAAYEAQRLARAGDCRNAVSLARSLTGDSATIAYARERVGDLCDVSLSSIRRKRR